VDNAVSIHHQTTIAGLMVTKFPILTPVEVAIYPNKATREKPLGRIAWADARPTRNDVQGRQL
jgi:hypothetical protein